MNSASVLDPATVGWERHLYAMVPPARQTHTPPKEHRVLGQVAQSELAYVWAISGSNCGRSSRMISFLLLHIHGGDPTGHGVVHQK
jgi:hypothetical protein